VAHSLSPRIQNAALRAAGIEMEYELLDVPPSELRAMVRKLRSVEAAGNVTIPHKAAVFKECDHLTAVAQRAGAVNTFWMQDGTLVGDNTDVAGFDFAAREILESVQAPLPRRVALLGAGGAAAAVATAVSDWDGAELVVWSRRPEQGTELAKRFDCASAESDLCAAVKGADLVVNATPVGLLDDAMPAPIAMLPRKCPILDLVCLKGETEWVREARDAGHPAADGLAMLVEQAARSFRRWFTIEPNREVMWCSVT
jgi:shikimate dehydrogenase